MIDAIQIGGTPHAIRLPASIVVRHELLNWLLQADQAAISGEGDNLRAYAASLCLCLPTLAPPRLPAWTGDNRREIGAACADHLTGTIGLTRMQIAEILTGIQIVHRLIRSVPTEAMVQVSMGNSSPGGGPISPPAGPPATA